MHRADPFFGNDQTNMLRHGGHLQIALEAGPAYRLATLSELMIYSGSDAMSCRSHRIPA